MELLSNQLLMAAILGYLAAMLCYLAEYSFGGRSAVARAAVRAPRERELATVGGGADRATDVPDVPPVSPTPPSAAPLTPAAPLTAAAPPRDRAGVFGRIAVGLTVLAALLHAGVVVTRGLAADRVPWGNMYEFVLTLSFFGAVTWLVLVAWRPALRLIGLFVTLVTVLVLGFAGVVLYTDVAPLMPALNSYWLKIHVSAAALASGLLLIAFVPSGLYLIRAGYDRGKRRFPYSVGAKLPEAETLERLGFRLHAFAFPIWTLAIICGAIWAEAAWGRYWGWDPKEVWSFISWVAYAAYLHARATPSVKRMTATWFAVIAWGTMLVNLYVINFVAVGLHSYAQP
jgi:cytochrome c-type biogenesis protein CcsB